MPLEVWPIVAAYVYSYLLVGDFKLSSQFLEPSCHTVGIIYGENSLQYANELQKLASIFFHW